MTLFTKTMARLALARAVRTNGAANGNTIDLALLKNNFRSVMFVVTTDTITDGSHAITLEHSTNGTDFTAVPAERRQGSLPTVVAADDDKIFEFGYIVGVEQYVRIVATTSGATTGGAFTAVALLSGAAVSPPTRS